MTTKIKITSLVLSSALLAGCSGFFDKDNTPPPSPLVRINQETSLHNLWQTNTGVGVGTEYLRLVPAITNTHIFVANKDGEVVAINKSGQRIWHTQTRVPISAGTAANDGIVVVGGKEGEVIALRECDGTFLWQSKVTSEILATPTIGEGAVLVKAIDGSLTAFSVSDGHLLWSYQETEPLLILRGASSPKIHRGNVIVGFENGSLSRLTLREGSQIWHQPIATAEGSFAIQRMIDIDADPIVWNNRIYAATYQGKVAALDFNTGKEYWNHDISSYIGIAADSNRVYVSDAKSHLWAFDANSGAVFWRQCQLEFRSISGPTVLGQYVVVGDEAGYLHVMSKQDGHFVGRVRIDSSGILATPVAEGNVLYVLTRKGRLAAYALG